MAITQARMFLEAGVDPSRVCIGHMDIPCCLDVMDLVLDMGFYVDFEQWALDYALIKNKKEMGNKDNMNESKKIIDILQSMLEKMNYKNRRKRQIKW